MSDIWETLYFKAKEQYHPEEVSPFVYAHHVVCALESANGEIYTGFCIESCSGVMDLCAERVAALNMYMHSGQTVVKRLIAFRDKPPFGSGSGMPCGVCREFFMQLSLENRNMEIMVDYEKRQTVTLEKLMPDWWGMYRYEEALRNEIAIREMEMEEYPAALELCRKVFREFEASDDHVEESTDAFYKCICDKEYLNQLRIFGAYDDERLAGVIATRSKGSHIALFFVDEVYQGRGIGRKLFECILKECPAGRMTVNSSHYAIPIYHRFGFHDTDQEQIQDGILFTPMEREV